MKSYRGDRKEIWDKTGGRCVYCGLRLVPDGEGPIIRGGGERYASWMECDHLHPKRFGGSDDISNIVPSCQICNNTKRTKTLEEYRHWLSYEFDGRPKFTAVQRDWLIQNGFTFPPLETHVFWFEANCPDLFDDTTKAEGSAA